MRALVKSRIEKGGPSFVLAALLLVTAFVLAGCALAVGTAAVGVGAAGAAGYSVYKTGEDVVTGGSEKPADDSEPDTSAIKREATQQFPKPRPKTASPPPSAAPVVYYKNEFKAQCDAGIEEVWNTAKSTLPRMALVITSQSLDGTSGMIHAETVDNTPIELAMQSVGPKATLLRIRVGANGDLKYSELIYNLIRDDLAKSGASGQTAPAEHL